MVAVSVVTSTTLGPTLLAICDTVRLPLSVTGAGVTALVLSCTAAWEALEEGAARAALLCAAKVPR